MKGQNSNNNKAGLASLGGKFLGSDLNACVYLTAFFVDFVADFPFNFSVWRKLDVVLRIIIVQSPFYLAFEITVVLIAVAFTFNKCPVRLQYFCFSIKVARVR